MERIASVVVLLWAVSCGSSVTSPAPDGSSGTGASSTTTSSTAGAGGAAPACTDSKPLCADDCGSDYFPEEAACVGGAWQCPAGTVNPDDCPAGTCWGAPLSCESCGDAGWECSPTSDCVSCGFAGAELVCATCPDDPSPSIIGACECRCDDANTYQCQLAPGCCTEDFDCGDFVFVPCVNNVCKQTVPNGCWSDAECLPEETCVGASVCPCGADCDAPDAPGTCQ